MSQNPQSEVYDPEFERRMKIACDNILDIPTGKGRASWIVKELEIRGVEVSLMTALRWLQGRRRPRHKRMVVLAEILRCDLGWLEGGDVPELDKKQFDATADAAVNLMMGFIQWAGWHCALAEDAEPFIHFHSIIRGKRLSFHVASGVKGEGDIYSFRAPPAHVKCVVLGVVEKTPTSFEVLHIIPDFIDEFGETASPLVRVELIRNGNLWMGKSHRIPIVTDFSQPFAE